MANSTTTNALAEEETRRLTDADAIVHQALQVEYAEMAPWYDKFWKPYLDQTLLKPLALVRDAAAVPNKKTVRVADVACGTGVFLERLLVNQHTASNDDLASKLIGVEPSLAMLNQARAKFPPPNDKVVEFHSAPAEYLPLADKSVHVICSTNAFHFFTDKVRALAEMHRVLEKGGKLVITDWCNDYLLVRLYHFLERVRWMKFKHRYPGPLGSKAMLELVKAAGFEQVYIETYTVRFWFIITWGMHTITATKSTD